jgi:hypothetical protein
MLKEKDFNSIPLLSVNPWEQYVKLYTIARTRYKCAWYHSPLSGHRIPEERPDFAGHRIPEERPDFAIDQLSKFFGKKKNNESEYKNRVYIISIFNGFTGTRIIYYKIGT